MRSICGLFCLLAVFLLANSDFTNAQSRRNQSPRAGPTGRALGLNPKGTSSSSSEFQCPEEFGYFPHPSDCSLYYVCVFGGALLESCTGGLMYSHELQTCDWPRNVGCEAAEVSQPATSPAREVTPRVPQVSSRVRFSSVNVEQTAPSGPSGPSGPSAPSAPAHIQQIQTLPPPPNQQRISPKPVITSRGQPPSFTQDEILKLYEEAHDTLPPAEEEETDRNQRVYRGQPSTVTQVQRDRDGIIHQPSVNAIPTQNKVGSFAYTNSQIPPFTSEDELQDLDITKHKVLDRKRRDLSSLTDSNEESKLKTEHLENESETETDSTKRIEKRSNDDETHVASLDEVSEILEGSENSDDVQRRTRQLRPSIISSPWRISNGRAVNYSPSHQNSFGSSFSGFPSAQSGFLYKSDGRFYPTNPFKTSSDDFSPVISTYSGNNNKNKYNFQSFGSNSGSSSGYAYESSDRDQEATPKYKQSSKIPSQSSALLPLIYSLESFEPKAKQTTTSPPIESQDNYSYFHLGKSSSSQQQQHQQQHQQYQDKVKTYAFPITNQQPQQTTTQRSFVSFNSVGGFFNNNQQQSNQGFSPLKSIQSSSSSGSNNSNKSNKVTPAPIYEGIKSASSYDSRYTSPAPIKKSQSTPHYSSNGFLNNLSFNKNTASVFNFGIDSAKEREKQREEKVVEITTKKQSYKQQQYPIPTSTPKYIQSYTTPNQLFDVDKFIAELRETQRLQNVKNVGNFGGNVSPHHNVQQQQSIFKINKTQSQLLNKTPTIRYQYFTSPSPSSTTASPDEYYYDDEDEEVVSTYDNGANLSKLKVQNDKVNSNKDNYSSHTLNKKPNLISSNAAPYDDDEYYEDYEDEEEEFKFLPPPINKPKYTPMTETMAPRPINVTTLRPYYVSGQTFSTPSPISSTIPSIIKFPDDVFQAIRPFTSLSPKTYSNNNGNKFIKTNHLSGSYDFTKGTTTPIPHSTTKLTTKIPITTTSTERTTTRKTKLKIITKATTAGKKQQVTSTTVKPTRTAVTTTRRKLYTSKANNRGTLRFKPTTKRPDLTRLEIDEKLPNRVEQSSPAPSAFNIPSKTQITQNKNYYNTSNYNTNFDPFYPSYDDGVDIYPDVDYSNIYNQPKSTPSSTYRPTTTQSPQTYATRPQTQSTTYLTQTPAPPKQKYNQQNIYSSADYDDGLNAQLEESERYGQQEEDSSNFRGDRNELSPTFERKLPKVQSPSSFSNGQKYSSVPAIVKLSTPEPFSYKPTVPVTQRVSSTFSSSTTRSYSSTKFPQTFPTTQRTTTQEPPQYYPTRSSLSDGTNKTANNRLKITLSARAGSLNPLQKVYIPLNVPIHSPPPSFIPSINYTDTLPSTTLTKTSTSTFSSSTTKSTTTVQPQITPPSVQVVNIQLISNSNSNNNNYNNNNDKFNSNSNNNNNNRDPLPDHYYYSEQDGQFDYYDNVDEISIPSSSIKPLVNNNIKNHHSSSSSSFPSKSSSNSLSQSSLPVKSYVDSEDYDKKYKLPNFSELRYDQSTLKSFFMNSNPTTENLMLASLRQSTVLTTIPTSTEKSTSTVRYPTTTRDFEEQRQRILSFIISENQPSSFKAPSTTTTQKSTFIDNTNNYSHSDRSSNRYEYFNAFVNTQSSPKTIESTTVSTTTTPPRHNVQSSVINQTPKTTVLISREQLTQNNNKPIRLTLSSSLDGFEKKKVTKDKEFNKGTVEEIPLLKSRQPEVKQSLYLKPIEPTTYSPPKSFRFTTETTTEPSTTSTTEKLFEILNEEVEDPESFSVHSRRRPYVNDFLTSSTIPTRFPPRTTTTEVPSSTESSTLAPTSTSRPIVQSFTSRGLVFKEILNKTLESQSLSKAIVSPYISLETQRLTNAIRTTPRTNYVINNNNINKESTTTSTQSTPVSTYRSYFLITAPPKTINPEINNQLTSSTTVPSTYLFPESSTTKLVSNIPTASPLILSTVKESSSSERKRGKYRPYISFTSSSSNSLDDEATTYSPRIRFNARTTESSVQISSEQPVAVRRKVIRFKSGLTPSVDTPQSSSTERVTTYNPTKKNVFDKFVPSQPRDSSDTKPILTKLNEFISKLSHSADIFGTTSKGSSYNDLTNENVASVVEVTEKPFYRTRLSNLNNNNNNINSNLRNLTELHDTTTKKFRATVEMPEMNVPEEKDEKINVNSYSDDSYDEEENDERPYIDIIDDHDEFIAAVNVESSTLSSTASPSPSRYFYNTSYSSTLHETPTSTLTTSTVRTTTIPETTVTEPTTILRTTTENVLSTSSTTNPKSLIPPRATRVNNAIKSSISAGLPRRNSNSASIKCNDVSSNAKCNEIPSRPSNRNPSRGSSAYAGETQSTVTQNSGRGTSPTRTRPTLKPANIVTKDAQQFVDIYRHQPTRIEPLYPQPVPDKTAAKCRKDVCLLPDCYCGGKDIPGKLPLDETPQLVLITFEDSVNDVHNKVFEMLFNSSRKNPNGCEIRATFFISHEWTDYGLVQDLYADGHEIASHSISHSFGEQFSLKKWAREIAGQREILSAYGGVKQDDIRGMRAPFLSIGGNKMFKMLYDFNFTYDSSMPVYENRPPSWPYTLDYKLFHDCMIPPCPTKSYPGVWEVPMVMWQDLNGGRCSMGDACSNPSESEEVTKMIMKNFERHYTTNRAPFGLFYHAAWFTQPHHKEGFIKFLDAINSMKDVYIVTNWQALQWVRDPTPLSRMQSFQPFQCNYQDRPKRCNNPKVCNLWHKSGVRYMRTCQPCPEIYPWTGKTGIRSSRIDNDLEVVEST